MSTIKETFEAIQRSRQAIINFGEAYKAYYLLPVAKILKKFQKDIARSRNYEANETIAEQ